MTTAEALPTVHFTCGKCQWTGEFDSRFTQWCMSCGEGANTRPREVVEKERSLSRGQRRRRDAAVRRAENLAAALAQADDLRPGGVAVVGAIAFGLGVYALGLAVLVGSVFLATKAGSNVFGWIASALGIGSVVATRPRFPKGLKRLQRKGGGGWRGRDELPHFYGLLDRVAAAIDAPVPTVVRFDGRYNASTNRLGLRQRPVLTVGFPLWSGLNGGERLALLGHELGHQVNGDTTRGLLVRTAERSLAAWQVLFRPVQMKRTRKVEFFDRSGRTLGRAVEPASIHSQIAQVFASLCLFPIFLVSSVLRSLFRWLVIYVSLRAEFLADDMGARVAGTESAVSLLGRLSMGPSTFAFVRRFQADKKAAARAGGRQATTIVRDMDGGEVLELWAGIAEYQASIPQHEVLRYVAASKESGTGIDDEHPADHLRVRVASGRTRRDAAVTVSAEEWQAIDAELAPHAAAIARSLLRG